MWGQPGTVGSRVKLGGTYSRVRKMAVIHEEDRSLQRHRLKFRWLPGLYAVVHMASDSPIPDWATKGEFNSITRTPDELSIVCPTENLPPDLNSPHRWICFKLEGPFPFSMTGVLLSFIGPLSTNGIPIFAVSTYDTDYVLIQEEWGGTAIAELQREGHELLPKDESSRKSID